MMPGSSRSQLTLASLVLAACFGCGTDNSVSEGQPSQAAINADEAGRKAMQEYMETQGKTKAKSKSAPGGGPR